MITCKEVDYYLEYVKVHPKWINKERRLLIKNIVKPLLKRKDIIFDETTYYNCIKYCENNYYQLFPYQKFIYAFAFMYWEDTYMPVFPKFFIMMGRGNGKDGFIVPLANFFQTPLYGIMNYHVELVANSEAQIKDTYEVAYNVMTRPKFKGKFKVTKEEIRNITTNSIMRYNTSNAGTKDGKRPGCLIFNEFHAYENYDRINVFESGRGKIEHGREFIITTQGYTRDGPLDDTLTACRNILESGDNPLGYFPFICCIDNEKEVDDPESWHKANPSMEYMPVLAYQIEMDYKEISLLPNKRPEFITKRMNLPQRNEEQTVTSWNNILRCCYSDIEKKIPRETEDTKGQLAVIGIDYADIRDFASAGVLTIDSNGNYIWRQHTWICAESPFLKNIKFPIDNAGLPEFMDFEVVEGPVIPISMIVDWCEVKMTEYDVQKIAMDTYRYTLFKKEFEERGISIEDKKNPEGLVRLIRKIGSVTGIIAPTIEKLFSEGKIDYGLSSIMRWYTNNTSVSTDKFGNKTFGKIEPKLRKNDGFMALLVAMYCSDELEENIVYI